MGTSKIGTLNEKPLHEALKRWYAQPGDMFEVPVDGFVADIVRGDLLIEIQTRNFTSIKRKLEKLLINHPVRLVYPIPREKWITKLAADGNSPVSRRRSPKRGAYEEVFWEPVGTQTAEQLLARVTADRGGRSPPVRRRPRLEAEGVGHGGAQVTAGGRKTDIEYPGRYA